MLTHKFISLLGLVVTLLSGSAFAVSAQYDPNSAEGFVKLNRKLQCSLVDGEETVFRWS